jgi:hypothetical protein
MFGILLQTPCAPDWRRARFTKRCSKNRCDRATGQASFESKRIIKAAAAKTLGAAGLSFSLLGGASASAVLTSHISQSDNRLTDQRFALGEGEMADVSLATFHLFDRENFGSGVQIARGCGGRGGCRGCGGGGGYGGFRGCGGGFVCGCRACRGCGGCGCGIGLGLGSRPEQVETAARQGVCFTDEMSLALWHAFGLIHPGWALSERGTASGLDEIEAGCARLNRSALADLNPSI